MAKLQKEEVKARKTKTTARKVTMKKSVSKSTTKKPASATAMSVGTKREYLKSRNSCKVVISMIGISTPIL
jgi:hypothetical protein